MKYSYKLRILIKKIRNFLFLGVSHIWWGNIMKVIKNYLYNLSYQILTIILPIITVSYVTRIFTSEDLGNYGFYNSMIL